MKFDIYVFTAYSYFSYYVKIYSLSQIKVLPPCYLPPDGRLVVLEVLFCDGAQQGSIDSPTVCRILNTACPIINPITTHENNSTE